MISPFYSRDTVKMLRESIQLAQSAHLRAAKLIQAEPRAGAYSIVIEKDTAK